MFAELLKALFRSTGRGFVLLDAALPGPLDLIEEFYPILIPVFAVIAALIVVLVSRHRRRKRQGNDADRPDGSQDK